MEFLLTFIISFIIIFIIFFIIGYAIPVKRNMLCKDKTSYILIKRYNLKLNDKQKKELMLKLMYGHTLILSIPIAIGLTLNIGLFYIWLISFVLFIVLMLIVYDLIGKSMKKEGNKNGNRRNKKN